MRRGPKPAKSKEAKPPTLRLCGAEHALIYRFDDQVLKVVAAYNISPELGAFNALNPIVPGRGSCAGRVAIERRTVHIHDAQADPEYTFGRARR